jgi:Nif-specific regulatory protein
MTAYLVVCRDDGYGDVFPVAAGQTYTLGCAPNNQIVLKDDLCSREHAEVFADGGRWRLRDLHSLNGTRVNDIRIESDRELEPRDKVQLGRTQLLFVEDMGQLPDVAAEQPHSGDLAIKKRLNQTRFLTPVPVPEAHADPRNPEQTLPLDAHGALSRDLSLLYRLALDMGSASKYDDVCQMVLSTLLEATPADVGAVLTVKGEPANKPLRGAELEVTCHRHRDPSRNDYVRASEYVSNEVMASHEAVLAADVARDRYLRNRESLNELGATSLICAPVVFGERVLGLIHLYCTDPHKALDTDNLESTVAVAKQLGSVIHQLRRTESLAEENKSLRDQLRVESELVGESAAVKEVERQIGRVAGTNATCLVRGESGAGKELVARAVHYSSPRKDGPFVTLNCAALTETLLESELFGHEKGSFTGATEKKVGKFEAAHRGTIFLDEIGEMNVGTQAKLLRILEGHPYERVGGSVPIQVDVRVVAATNQPLEQAVHAGEFRRDLFFRLQVVEIRVPPLRERKSDLPLLADHFLKRFVRETGRKIRGFTPAARQKMHDYHWPGNVRELRNVVERAVALGTGPILDVDDIQLSTLASLPVNKVPMPSLAADLGRSMRENLAREELLWIEKALAEHEDKGKASEALYGNRFRLTRRVNELLQKHPCLRDDTNLKRLADQF